MATITDLTGNELAEVDLTSTEGYHEDSNINVYEFGNLLLAGIFPLVVWVVNFVADLDGSELTEVDDTLNNSHPYNWPSYTYNQSDVTYNGIPLEGYLTDKYGSSISGVDVTVAVLTITDVLFGTNTITDISVDSLTVTDNSGESISTSDASSATISLSDISGTLMTVS